MKKRSSLPWKATLVVLISLCLVFSIGTLPVLVSSESGVDLVAMTPNVDIKVNIGTTTLTESFLADLKAALVALGIDAGKIGISLASSQSFNPADVSLWDRYDHIGDWEERAASIGEGEEGYTDANGDYHDYDWDTDHFYYPNMDPGNDGDFSNDPHILTSADGGTLYFYGYGEPAYNDFLLSRIASANDKQILFTIDEATATYHSLIGSGFLLNAKVEDSLLSAYAVLVTEYHIKLVQIDALDIDEFHDSWDDGLTSLDGVTTLETFSKPDVTVHNFELNLVGNTISIRDNGEYLTSAPVSPLDWDPISAYYAGLDLGKTLYTWYWDEDAARIYLNGDKKSTVTALITDVDTAGSTYNYLVLQGYQPNNWSQTNLPDGVSMSLDVWENDYYSHVIKCTTGTVLDSSEDAYAYMDEKGYTDYTNSQYYFIGSDYYIRYDDTTYKNCTPYELMTAKIAAHAEDGIDISDYNDNWMDGTDFVWEYNDENGDSQEVRFPITDFVPDFVSKSSENYSLPETLGYRFGPLVAYDTHECEDLTAVTFSNLAMNLLTSSSSLSAVAEGQIYGADSRKFFVNLEDAVLAGLDVPALGDIFDGQGAAYIGVGTATSQSQEKGIATAAGAGTFVLKADAAMVDKVAAYIYAIVKAKIIENVIVTYPVETTVTYGDGTVETEGFDSAVDILDDLLAGSTVELKLDLTAYVTEDVPVEEKALVQSFLDGQSNPSDRNVFFIDVDLIKIVTSEGNIVETTVTETLKPITISIVVPESMRGKFDYEMVRIHDGVLEVLKTTYDPTTFTLTFTTDKFSTYGVTFSNSDTNPQTGDASPVVAAGLALVALAGLVVTSRRKRSNR